ncbi:MAG TPA: hypothetical protein PK185_16185 [Cyclobacteriaceae bacterium]|nr:hypothetical protein [Cyclobacteriaceae bacterium]
MKARLLIMPFFFLGLRCFGQLNTYLENGYGFYSMEDMKSLQGDYITQSRVSLKKISSFPSYFNYGIGTGYELKSKLEIGITYRYLSTGGRLDYSDYSGQARIDQLLRANAIGVYTSKPVNESTKWPLVLGINISRIYTTVDIETSLVLGNDNIDSSTVTLNGNGWGFYGSLMLQRYFTDRVFAFGKLGIEAFANKNLQVDGNDTSLKADWSGVRVALGIGFSLTPKNSTAQPK